MDLDAHRRRNQMHAIAIIGALVVQAVALGWVGGGWIGAAMVAGLILLGLRPASVASPAWILRRLKAEPLSGLAAQGAVRLFRELAGRSQLTPAPGLFWFDHPLPNAFVAGSAQRPVVVVSSGLLGHLSQRQLAGVLAHELSHVLQGDLRVSNLLALLSGVHRFLGRLGVLIVMVGSYTQSIGTVLAGLVLTLGPGVSHLTTMTLSRQREFRADLGAAQLTGDPLGLASALQALRSNGAWERWGPRHDPGPWDTHPDTDERVKRLRQIAIDFSSS